MEEHLPSCLPYLCNWCLALLPATGQAIFTDCGSLFCSGECAYRCRQGVLCTACGRHGCRMLRIGEHGAGLPSSHRRCLYAKTSELIEELHQALAFREVQLQRIQERIQQCGLVGRVQARSGVQGRSYARQMHPNASKRIRALSTRTKDDANGMDACVSQTSATSHRQPYSAENRAARIPQDAPLDSVSQSGTRGEPKEAWNRIALSEGRAARSPAPQSGAPTWAPQSSRLPHLARTYSERLDRIRRVGSAANESSVGRTRDRSTWVTRPPSRTLLGLPPLGARCGIGPPRQSTGTPSGRAYRYLTYGSQATTRGSQSSIRAASGERGPIHPWIRKATEIPKSIRMELGTLPQVKVHVDPAAKTRAPPSMNPLHWLASASKAPWGSSMQQGTDQSHAGTQRSASSTVSHTLVQREEADRPEAQVVQSVPQH